MEEEQNKINPDVKLKKYLIISHFFEPLENEDINAKELELPTPESLQKLSEQKIVKETLNFDLKKYSSFFEKKDGKEEEYLNLDKFPSLTDINLVNLMIVFVGGINSDIPIFDILDDETIKIPEDDCKIDYCENYLQYLNSIIGYLKTVGKLVINLSEFELFLKSLEELGISIPKDNKNILYRNLKDSILSAEKNKILILIAPSNNFWIKSEKKTINDKNYDIMLNNYSSIFYNHEFIKKFFEKISIHPRCVLGFISSMKYRNLKNCWDGLEKLMKQFSSACPKKVILIDQEAHDEVPDENDKKKKKFFRNMEKIKESLKKLKKNQKDDDSVNLEIFNESNILILESEDDKIIKEEDINSTKNNNLFVNTFSEKYLEFDEQKRKAIDLQGDKAINYILNLLENCNVEIRTYLSANKISNEDSKV